MSRSSRFPLQMMGITLGVLAGLLVLPATRWLLVAQVASVVPGRPSAIAWAGRATGFTGTSADDAARAAHRVAVAMPEDYPIQLADTLTGSGGETPTSIVKVARLRELAARFPDRPSVFRGRPNSIPARLSPGSDSLLSM